MKLTHFISQFTYILILIFSGKAPSSHLNDEWSISGDAS